jgi:hypothetical protein
MLANYYNKFSKNHDIAVQAEYIITIQDNILNFSRKIITDYI